MDNPTLLCLFGSYEPVNFEEVVQDKRWRDPTHKEVQAINEDNMWDLLSIPKDHKAINGRWMYMTEKNANGKIGRHKAKLVA
jgi:hypothetical protein